MKLPHFQIYTKSKISNFAIRIRLFLLDILALQQKKFLKKYCIINRQYLKTLQSARFYIASMQKSRIILEASAKNYR